MLAGQDKALVERLSAEAVATRDALTAQREAATQAAVELRAMLTAAAASQAEKQAQDMATLRRDQQATASETKQVLEAVRTTLAEAAALQGKAMAEQMNSTRDLLDARLKELREGNEQKLGEIQKSVNEQLQSAVEKQMNESFSRVIDQFTAVQKAMGDVQAVTGQIGDIKRLFSNVKTRGGWGETQVRLLLDDLLPPGSYETNIKLSPDSGEAVEFAVHMPMQGGERVLLPIDAKFPVEDYERLILAAEAGDAEAEKAARRALERRVKDEAAKIAAKYILPPITVDFAVLYLPTDGLYAEVARIPGLIEEIGRVSKVLVLGPSVFPALLRTIQLGYVTLALNQKADLVRELLGATKAEMQKMEGVLTKLSKNVGTLGRTISDAQVRTRAVARKLRGIDAIALDRVDQVLELTSEAAEDEGDSAEDET
ncbi:DNA recombination protein RmuC [Acetobacteraceae bacterium H6797]|nr:DNA recombination protein RmuC [Acetobacteraceae bacterium H6797]